MKFPKRIPHPLFLEEEGYNWKTRRSGLANLLIAGCLCIGLLTLTALIVSSL